MNPQEQSGPHHELVHQELEERRQAYAPQRSNWSASRWALIALAVLILIAVAIGYVATGRKHAGTTTPPTSATATDQTQMQAQPDTASDTSEKQYITSGKDLDVQFTYPGSWTAQPASGSNNDQPITVTSPPMSITSASAAVITGKVTITIFPGGTALTELADDKAIAAQASTQIAYDKPTSAQHQYPYITFIHIGGGNNPNGGFEEIAITGVTTFTKGQAVYGTSLTAINPLITARFYTCNNASCSVTTPLSITNSTWLNDETCKQALAIFQSLQIN